MIWTIVAIFVVLWIVGMSSSYTMGGLIHILLIAAIVVITINLVRGRNL